MLVAQGLVLILVATSSAFGDITVAPSRGDRTHAAWSRSIAGLDRPSQRTLETLRRLDLEPRFKLSAENTLAALERQARKNPESDVVYALAELSWIEGNRLERRRSQHQAFDRFVDAVAYSYDYLFAPILAPGRSPSDPRFRLACDLYNAGLDRILRVILVKGGERLEAGVIRLNLQRKEHAFRVLLRDSPWRTEDVAELMLCSDFEVSGLDNRSEQYGLGVPVIAVRRTSTPGQGIDHFYPAEMAFPLTAFLRPTSKLTDEAGAVTEPREFLIELIDPILYRAVGQGPGALPLEYDLTTPLAYMWSRTDLKRYSWNGLLRPGTVGERAGLMLLRPYEPGKIPVIMVHGLISSPLAWIPMLNELLRDTRIQKNYQFLLYLYPTGVPLPIAAAGLREALLDAQVRVPVESRANFDQMVLLGHSMGGLLSHASTVHSGNRFWELNSDRPFDEIIGPPEVLNELKRYFFFEPLPFVKRVVYLAVPHRGSEVSRGVIGRLGTSLISESDHINSLLSQLIKDNPDAFDRRRFRRLPTSIESLEPDAPVLLALLAMKPGANVLYHSIIGANRAGPVATTTDGVVPFRSAHLEGVASERVVRSDHGVQKDPEAILEVRRILLDHLNGSLAARSRLGSMPIHAPMPLGATDDSVLKDLPDLPRLVAPRSTANDPR